MYKNSKKQGDAGLGKAISYFTELGYEVALPLTDSADWDLIVQIDGELKKVQVKTSSQMRKSIEVFEANVKGGNRSSGNKSKDIQDQDWDLIFLHHLITKRQALIPKDSLTTKGQINLGEKYKQFIIGDAGELEILGRL
jgi:hypothetical protein